MRCRRGVSTRTVPKLAGTSRPAGYSRLALSARIESRLTLETALVSLSHAPSPTRRGAARVVSIAGARGRPDHGVLCRSIFGNWPLATARRCGRRPPHSCTAVPSTARPIGHRDPPASPRPRPFRLRCPPRSCAPSQRAAGLRRSARSPGFDTRFPSHGSSRMWRRFGRFSSQAPLRSGVRRYCFPRRMNSSSSRWPPGLRRAVIAPWQTAPAWSPGPPASRSTNHHGLSRPTSGRSWARSSGDPSNPGCGLPLATALRPRRLEEARQH